MISHINSPGHATRTNQRLDEIGNSNVAIRAEKLLKSWQKASPANGQCGPGHANRDGFPCFPLSLSLEPNGHIGASCYCHPLSIHSGLAPSSQLSETQTPLRFGCPNPTEVWLRAARFSEGTGPFASHPANGVQNVQVLVCLDALWVRRTGAKTRQVRRSHLSGPAV